CSVSTIFSADNFSTNNLVVTGIAVIGGDNNNDSLTVNAPSTFNGNVTVNGTLTTTIFATPYDNVATVAKSGGDYTTIEDALDSITDNVATTITDSSASGGLSQVAFNSASIIEDYTITFSDELNYSVSGSVTGADGSGSLTTSFTSDSGKLTINQGYWSGTGWIAGDTVTVSTDFNRYLVRVMPGEYSETSPLVLKSYVDIVAVTDDWNDTIITSSSDTNLITAADNASLSGLTLQLTGSGTGRSIVNTADKVFKLNNNRLDYAGSTDGYGITTSTGTVTIDAGEIVGTNLVRGVNLTGAGTVNIWSNKIVSTTDDLYAAAGTINSYYNRLQGAGDNVETASGAIINSLYDQLDSTKITSAGTFVRKDQPLNTLVVAKGQVGNFDTITEALNEISRRGDASSTNLYTVEVLPGVYDESITMLDYVDIIGVGGEIATKITQADADVVTAASNAKLQGLTLEITAATAARSIINAADTSPVLDKLRMTYSGGTAGYGLYTTTGEPRLSNAILSGASLAKGVYQTDTGTTTVEHSAITATTDIEADAGTIKSYFNVLTGTNNIDIALGATIDSGNDILDSTKITSAGTYNALGKPQNTIYVAKGQDGHYDTITEALAAISTASSSNPYTIKVFPGVYDESITMEEYVDIVGIGGSKATYITQSDSSVITGSSNSTLRGFTLSLTGDTTGKPVVSSVGTSSPRLEDLVITGTAGVSTGISSATGSPEITNVIISSVSKGVVHTGTSGITNIHHSTITASTADLEASGASGSTIKSSYNRLSGTGNNILATAGATVETSFDIYKTITTGSNIDQHSFGATPIASAPALLVQPQDTSSWSDNSTGDGTYLAVNTASGFTGNILDLQVDGSSKMVVEATGSVGIGTTAPSGVLHVVGDETRFGSGGTIDYADGNGDVYIQNDLEVDGILYAPVSITGGLIPTTDNTEDMGTATYRWRTAYFGPSALSISDTGDTSGAGSDYVNMTLGFSGEQLQLLTTLQGSQSAGGNILIQSALPINGAGTAAIRIASANDLGTTDTVFQVGDNAADFLTILGAGNVGIGITNPGYLLDVAGTFRATGAAVLGATLDVTGDTALDSGLTIGDAAGDTVTVNSAAWTFSNNTTMALNDAVNALNIDSNTLSIDASTNRVGIGTTAPGAKLEVSDGTDSLQIASSGDLLFVDADGGASITGPAGGSLAMVAGVSKALTLTGNAASTWSTSSGLLTISGAGGVTIDSNSNLVIDTEGTSTITSLG
ncbi:MAG: hypothetical protein CO073_03960, partial [Candidatus Komeilibacteria bacterium CG_4_9_14_0_8_um_filter_36_9]